jgi:hypothetical protein
MEDERQDTESSIEQIRKALSQMKPRKPAPGQNEITADILKAGGAPVLIWLHEIFVYIWKNEEMIEDWSVTIIDRLFKKGDK